MAPPLETGVRAMGLNQILHDEQIAMIRHSSATAPSEISQYRREVGRFAGRLSLFTYPHRPYLAPSRAMMARKSAQASIADWENEGGAS